MIKIIATLLTIFAFSTSHAKTVNVGIILGFTGPIESLTPDMAAGAELAFSEASNSGKLLNGSTINVIRADSTCIDSAAATSAAEGLVSQGVTAIMGADCSGVTGAVLSNVAVPNGIPMISPSATSPALTTGSAASKSAAARAFRIRVLLARSPATSSVGVGATA